MSQIESALTRIRAKAAQIGVPALAELAGLDERTVRRIVRNTPVQIAKLKRLEAAATDPGAPVDQGCKVPPAGWWCSREPGHDGPCAARRSA